MLSAISATRAIQPISNHDAYVEFTGEVLFVQNYQGTGGTENISKMLLEFNQTHGTLTCANATLMDFTLKGQGDCFPLINHITELDGNGQQRTTTETVHWDSESRFADLQATPGLHIGRGPVGQGIEDICQDNYFLNLGHKTIPTTTHVNGQAMANRLDGVLTHSNGGFELNPEAVEEMKAVIQHAKPQVVYVAQDHAATLVSEAVKQLNDSRAAGQKIGIVYGIHREDLSISNQGTDEKAHCVAHNMKATHESIHRAVVCSHSAGDNYISVGGNPERMVVVENGTDCAKFSHDPEARKAFRDQHLIPLDSKVITLAGRFSSEKDISAYATIIARLLTQPGSDTLHFVGCGAMMSQENSALVQLLKAELGERFDSLSQQIHLLGFQHMPAVMSATDVVLSTSRTESWGLTLLEAAAAGCIGVYSDLPGTRNAMGSLVSAFDLCVSRKEDDQPDPLFAVNRRLSEHSINAFIDKLHLALELSNDAKAREAHVLRARETDVSMMYNGYRSAFEQAYQAANPV